MITISSFSSSSSDKGRSLRPRPEARSEMKNVVTVTPVDLAKSAEEMRGHINTALIAIQQQTQLVTDGLSERISESMTSILSRLAALEEKCNHSAPKRKYTKRKAVEVETAARSRDEWETVSETDVSEGEEEGSQASQVSQHTQESKEMAKRAKVVDVMIQYPDLTGKQTQVATMYETLVSLFRPGGAFADRVHEWIPQLKEFTPAFYKLAKDPRQHNEVHTFWSHAFKSQKLENIPKITDDTLPGLLRKWDQNGKTFIRYNPC